MDRTRKRRLKAVPPAPAGPSRDEALMAAVNEQVVPQLAHLTNGPLAVGAFEGLRATATNGQPVGLSVLQVRVSFEGKLYTVAVHVLTSP